MGPTVFTTSVCLVSRGEFVMETGGETTFPNFEDLIICPAASMDRPVPRFKRDVFYPRRPPARQAGGLASQYGVKRLYPPLYKLAC